MPRADGEPVIYLVGVAGFPNYGDELIAASWLRHLAKQAPDTEVWLDTPRPGQAAMLLGGIHPRLRCVDTLFHGCWNAPRAGVAEILEHGRQVVREPGLLPREATGVEQLSRAKLVHVIGGGYLNRIWPTHLALLGAAREMGERYGARTALTGAGLLPMADDGAAPLAELLSDFDVVDVRDEESLVSIHQRVPHATCSGDDVLLDLGSHLYDRSRRRGTLLCLQGDQLQVPLDQVADFVVATLRAWGADEDEVTLVECLPPGDTTARAMLAPHLPRLDVIPFAELWRQGLPAGPDQRWISTRFHPHLVAAAGGSWGVAVPISRDYYRTKHESLLALGSGWTLAEDLTRPVEPQPSCARPFAGRLGDLRHGKLAVADAVLSGVVESVG